MRDIQRITGLKLERFLMSQPVSGEIFLRAGGGGGRTAHGAPECLGSVLRSLPMSASRGASWRS